MKQKEKPEIPPLILASASPRRRELLSLCGIPFTTAVADIDEPALEETLRSEHPCNASHDLPTRIVEGLASAKAEAVFAHHINAVVIGSDTIVALDHQILGKPKTEDDALCMLQTLSGRTHRVLTGVCIKSSLRREVFATETQVRFYPWSPESAAVAQRYISTGSPMDKAGAYGIQDLGALFVQEIHGDYYTVMGFPIAAIYRHLSAYYPISPHVDQLE